MKVLGITGGVGSGKSEILTYLREEKGAVIVQMDVVARELQKRGSRCFERIVEAFGQEIVGTDGELDRAKLAGEVFSDREKLMLLNSIVHPQVLFWVRSDIEEKAARGIGLYVVESALLPDVEHGFFDEIWYIHTDAEVRRKRLERSRGYAESKIRDMITSQPSEERFRKICTAVIDNSGSFEDTIKQIGERL